MCAALYGYTFPACQIARAYTCWLTSINRPGTQTSQSRITNGFAGVVRRGALDNTRMRAQAPEDQLALARFDENRIEGR